MSTTFIDWVFTELEKQKMTPAELARKSGISAAHLSKVFSEKRNPGCEMVVAVAIALNQPPEEVMRIAGILPKLTGSNPSAEQAKYLIDKLPEDTLPTVIKVLQGFLPDEHDQRGGVG